MSNYWTEDTITTVQRTFIKGTFMGKYYAEHHDEWSQPHSEFYRMHIYQAEITLEEVRKDEEGDFPEVFGLRSFKGTFGQPVNCYDPVSATYFQLNLDEPRIADPILSKITKEGSEHMGTISGAIYGYVTKLTTEKVRTNHQIPDPNRPISPIQPGTSVPPAGVNSWTGWTRTATHEFSYINGFRYRRDYYRYGNGSYKWGNWYAIEEGWSFTSLIKLVLGLCFAGLLLFFLVSLSWPGLIILGIILLAVIVSRIRHTGFGITLFSLFYGLVLLLYFVGIAVSIFHGLNNKHPVTSPDHPPDKRDFTHTQPVKQNTVEPIRQTGSVDEWIVHHRAWTDFDGTLYEGDIRVLRSMYQRSAVENERIDGVSSLSDVYKAMTLKDESRLNGVYPLFDSLRTANRLDSIHFAGMLVSFVQDIPYTTVTDGICNGQGNDALSGLSDLTSYNCIGHIPYGVQSPVEFMANFQGDCDTRTLFLFTLLNHYHYRVAILGSAAFRHSLLGLDLPISGSAKLAGSERYVLWETTSKGFTAGHLSPEIDYMDYWDFYLINTPSS
jgi:hypothetical protein